MESSSTDRSSIGVALFNRSVHLQNALRISEVVWYVIECLRLKGGWMQTMDCTDYKQTKKVADCLIAKFANV